MLTGSLGHAALGRARRARQARPLRADPRLGARHRRPGRAPIRWRRSCRSRWRCAGRWAARTWPTGCPPRSRRRWTAARAPATSAGALSTTRNGRRGAGGALGLPQPAALPAGPSCGSRRRRGPPRRWSSGRGRTAATARSRRRPPSRCPPSARSSARPLGAACRGRPGCRPATGCAWRRRRWR